MGMIGSRNLDNLLLPEDGILEEITDIEPKNPPLYQI
jgi:hypothetical protein